MLRSLEENKGGMGITAYGLSVTTLEEVFLKVAQEKEVTKEAKQEEEELIRSLSNRRASNLGKSTEDMKSDRSMA